MTLSEKYKHLDVFKPYFVLWLNLTYDEKGEPWVIKIMNKYLSKEEQVTFRKYVLDSHKGLINLNHHYSDLIKNNLDYIKQYYGNTYIKLV